MPTVSIIIPVYKAEHYLDACMRSVVGQSCTDLEILLVDDGSPDRSPEMCDAWAARDPRVRVLHRKNGGAASARNAGLDAATGDFIFFADADDLLEPDAIEYLVKAEQQYGTDLVIGNMLYVDAENHPMAEPDFTGFTDTVRTVDEVWEHYFALDNRKVYYVVVWNKLYKRAMFDTLRFRDGKRYEDQFFMLDVLRRFGADVRETQDAVTVRRGALRGVTIDAAPIPDLIPVLSGVAALADGQTQFFNAARLLLKESYRLESTAAMLRALGAQVEVHDSGLTVPGRKVLTGGTVAPQHDHRLAMAAAAAASGSTVLITSPASETCIRLVVTSTV